MEYSPRTTCRQSLSNVQLKRSRLSRSRCELTLHPHLHRDGAVGLGGEPVAVGRVAPARRMRVEDEGVQPHDHRLRRQALLQGLGEGVLRSAGGSVQQDDRRGLHAPSLTARAPGSTVERGVLITVWASRAQQAGERYCESHKIVAMFR